MKFLTIAAAFGALAGFSSAQTLTPNWSGKYAPCHNHADLLNHDHVDLAVRISSANPALAREFRNAMEFWTEVLDLDWHEVDSSDCALQVVDGTPSVFDFSSRLSAKSQLPDRPAFQGWIAFNPRQDLTRQEMFLDSVHEIGHLLGLAHNPNRSSVMFAYERDKAVLLDTADLQALSARHQLRSRVVPRKGVRVVAPKEALMLRATKGLLE